MKPIRKINETERELLSYLMEKGSLHFPNKWYDNIVIQKMDDGNMGSFKIFEDISKIEDKRIFSKRISEFQFLDEDSVLVLVSLYIDKEGKPFEVDIWKTNYKPVLSIKVPKSEENK